MIIIGVDPGETTGLFVTGHGLTIGHMQPREWDAVTLFRHWLRMWPVDVVVMEKFNVHEKRTKLAGADINWPLDIIGAVKWTFVDEYKDRDAVMVGQWNYERRKVTDELLEERGYLAKPVTVMRHANDAARHVLKYQLNQERRSR